MTEDNMNKEADPDPRIIAIAKFLARVAAEKDYEEHIKATEFTPGNKGKEIKDS